MSRNAAEINAEKIEAILRVTHRNSVTGGSVRLIPREVARKIVEAFPELQQQAQYTSERDGTSRMIVHPLPWSPP